MRWTRVDGVTLHDGTPRYAPSTRRTVSRCDRGGGPRPAAGRGRFHREARGRRRCPASIVHKHRRSPPSHTPEATTQTLAAHVVLSQKRRSPRWISTGVARAPYRPSGPSWHLVKLYGKPSRTQYHHLFR